MKILFVLTAIFASSNVFAGTVGCDLYTTKSLLFILQAEQKIRILRDNLNSEDETTKQAVTQSLKDLENAKSFLADACNQ